MCIAYKNYPLVYSNISLKLLTSQDLTGGVIAHYYCVFLGIPPYKIDSSITL